MTTARLPGRSLEGGSGGAADRLFRNGTRIAGSFLVVALIAIGLMLWLSSSEAFGAFGLSFVTGRVWDPVAAVYGALPFVVGTILTSLIAVIIAAPIGLLTAIFLAELAPRRLSIPLTFMIEPTIVSIAREVISSVPASQREAMAALGATRWETVTKAVLPFARSGIIGAMILGLGRALGETIASKIATSFNEASLGLQTSSLIALGFILLVITIALNVVARLLVWRVAGPPGRG